MDCLSLYGNINRYFDTLFFDRTDNIRQVIRTCQVLDVKGTVATIGIIIRVFLIQYILVIYNDELQPL